MSGDWVPWSAKVPQVEVETHKVASPDVVVPTLDTVRHESLLYTWLAEHKPMVLCGPPGSGKTPKNNYRFYLILLLCFKHNNSFTIFYNFQLLIVFQ